MITLMQRKGFTLTFFLLNFTALILVPEHAQNLCAYLLCIIIEDCWHILKGDSIQSST